MRACAQGTKLRTISLEINYAIRSFLAFIRFPHPITICSFVRSASTHMYSSRQHTFKFYSNSVLIAYTKDTEFINQKSFTIFECDTHQQAHT